MIPNLANGEPVASNRASSAAKSVDDALHLLRNRSPQESLGLKDEHGLGRAFFQAAVATVVLLAALTAGPYFLDRPPPAPAQAANPGPNDGADSATPQAPVPAPVGPDVVAKKESIKQPAKKNIEDVLGENGTKHASPKINPLDKKEDDLLKDLK